ncbi:MAG: TraB/GumN family protein, partial [Alphaproteobacteria bacterium]|nr:TraB/GumN family protein [Alphaproteobacteria bacterium]
DRPGVTFMAVGAGHLAGRDSVIAMLRAKGVRVTRIQ